MFANNRKRGASWGRDRVIPKKGAADEATSKQSAAAAADSDRLGRFVPRAARRSLASLIVTESVAEQINVALARISCHEIVYGMWQLGRIHGQGCRLALNAFGPPGTGKSQLAEAIAHHLGKPIIRVDYSETESKYPGDTAKNIVAAFAQATRTNSVLFFDEADAILSKRLTNPMQSADISINVSRTVMLVQLDQFDGVVVFASNLPGNYDPAFQRRILSHIEMPLPDVGCRERLWAYFMPPEMPVSGDESMKPAALAEASEGFSGGEIVNVISLAAVRAAARSGAAGPVTRGDIDFGLCQAKTARECIGR